MKSNLEILLNKQLPTIVNIRFMNLLLANKERLYSNELDMHKLKSLCKQKKDRTGNRCKYLGELIILVKDFTNL